MNIANDLIINCEDFYAKQYRAEWEKNVLNKVFTSTGIDTYIEQNPEYTKEQVQAEINTNPMFAKCFIKDPVQTSCFERYAIEYIRKFGNVISCEKLKANGNNALYVFEGKLCHKKDIPAGKTKEVKSIDFKISYRSTTGTIYTIYASHKHTRKNGGNQNNQWYDTIHFASHANQSTDKNIIYIALVDGPYYSYTTDEGLTKLETLNQYKNDHFIAITTTDFVKNFLPALT